jgi:hypothetical protein
MLAGSALITAYSLAYFDFETLPPFVIERMPERFGALWLDALRVHVATALVAFPLCLVLTTRALQRRAALHRWLGRLSGVLVLFALVPSGVVLAFHAKGGSVVTAGFLLTASIVAWAMTRGIASARRRDLVSHRRSMRHVVGQMSVAVVSRAMLLGFDSAGIDPDVAYVIALWVPVLASFAVVELVSGASVRQLVERIRRDFSLPALALRARSLARPVLRLGR